MVAHAVCMDAAGEEGIWDTSKITCTVQLIPPVYREPCLPPGHHGLMSQGLPSPVPQARLSIQVTHEFEHVPVKDVVVGEALAVEEVAEELAQVRVVRLVVKPQGAAEVEVC
jgi:hypothetical protein